MTKISSNIQKVLYYSIIVMSSITVLLIFFSDSMDFPAKVFLIFALVLFVFFALYRFREFYDVYCDKVSEQYVLKSIVEGKIIELENQEVKFTKVNPILPSGTFMDDVYLIQFSKNGNSKRAYFLISTTKEIDKFTDRWQ